MPDDGKELVGAALCSASAVDPKALNLHQRMWAAMNDVSYVQKDKDAGSYKVVTHDAVTAKCRPALLKHGVLAYPQNMVSEQNGNRTEIRCDIRFINIDNPNDFIDVPTVGYGIDTSDKGPGKALSYAVKMALLKGLMLETGLDADDGTNVDHVAGETNLPVKKVTAGGAQITSGLTKTKLQAALRALAGDIEAKAKAGDIDELEGLLNDNVDLIDQCQVDLPGWWNSNPNNDVVGLKDRIDNARSKCRKVAQ